jgi:hypothetical protein
MFQQQEFDSLEEAFTIESINFQISLHRIYQRVTWKE